MAPTVFSTVGFEDYNLKGAQGMISIIHSFKVFFGNLGFVLEGKFGNSWTVSTMPCFGHKDMGLYLLFIF